MIDLIQWHPSRSWESLSSHQDLQTPSKGYHHQLPSSPQNTLFRIVRGPDRCTTTHQLQLGCSHIQHWHYCQHETNASYSSFTGCPQCPLHYFGLWLQEHWDHSWGPNRSASPSQAEALPTRQDDTFQFTWRTSQDQIPPVPRRWSQPLAMASGDPLSPGLAPASQHWLSHLSNESTSSSTSALIALDF